MIAFTTPLAIVTVAIAPVPLPVIEYNGTLLYCPSEYPIPGFVIDLALIGPPVDSINPKGSVELVPSLTFLPDTSKFCTAAVVMLVVVILNLRG